VRKEEIMTNVLTNIKDMVEIEELNEYSNPIMDNLSNFLKLKNFAQKHEKEIEKYTERNKKIRNGRTVIVGTRITTRELLYILSECKSNNVIEYVLEQYPSIDSEEKVLYGVLYELKKQSTLIYLLRILFSK